MICPSLKEKLKKELHSDIHFCALILMLNVMIAFCGFVFCKIHIIAQYDVCAQKVIQTSLDGAIFLVSVNKDNVESYTKLLVEEVEETDQCPMILSQDAKHN